MISRTELGKRIVVGIVAVFALVVLAAVVVETWDYLREQVATKLAPIIAGALGAGLFVLIVWFVWHLCADPTKRLAHGTRDALDYRFQRARITQELERRINALDEELQVRALAASARVHENAARAVSSANLRKELEELKGRSEQVVRRSQSLQLAKLLARYEAASRRLQSAESMSSAEKARLLADLRELLEEDASAMEIARAD